MEDAPMRLIAPTAFKGTMSPLEAAHHIAAPGDRLLPLSDGGDGLLECLHQGLGGDIELRQAADPRGRVRPVPVLFLEDGTAVVECAKVIGLAGLEILDPMTATSQGLGELLATLSGAPRLLVGLGGSATVDAGRDWPTFSLPPTTVFCDVLTDLADAARIYGPQKGARPQDIPVLTERLLSQGLPRGPRTGAAGGLGARLQFLGAELVDGAETMLNVLHFDEACRGCEAVVTGEGRLDASTMEGKLPYVVARRARALGIPVHGHFGCRGAGWERVAPAFDEISFET
jgi:glycerate kinase